MNQDWDPLQIGTETLAAELKALRGRCPVPHAEVAGLYPFWSLLSYEDVTRAARDSKTFVNAAARLKLRRVPLESDAPEHMQIRRLLQPFFLPAALQAFEPLSRQIASQHVQAFVAAGGGDAVLALARPVPAQIALSLIGAPREDWSRIKLWSEQTFLSMSSDPADQQLARAADDALWDYSRKVVEARSAAPGDPSRDPVTAMLQAQLNGGPMNPDLVVGTVRLVISAGHDSTTSSIGICLNYLAGSPADQSRLRGEPQLIPAAVEEILRYQSPVLMMPRTVARDVELRGRQLKAGDRLMLNWAAANRDEAVFEQPDRCLLDRNPNRHVVFGHGVHTCLGAPLARQELRLVLAELLARTTSFELAGPVTYNIWHRYSPKSLPLKLVAGQ